MFLILKSLGSQTPCKVDSLFVFYKKRLREVNKIPELHNLKVTSSRTISQIL